MSLRYLQTLPFNETEAAAAPVDGQPDPVEVWEVIVILVVILALLAMAAAYLSYAKRRETVQPVEDQRAAKRERREKRRQYVETHLVGRKWSEELSTDDSSSEEEDSSDATEHECPICMLAFEAGDEVCESNNLQCSHVFHRTCMKQWLEKHEECPMCRETYLLETV